MLPVKTLPVGPELGTIPLSQATRVWRRVSTRRNTRHISISARPPINEHDAPVNFPIPLKELSHNVTTARLYCSHHVQEAVNGRPGLIVLGAVSAFILLSICQSVWRAFRMHAASIRQGGIKIINPILLFLRWMFGKFLAPEQKNVTQAALPDKGRQQMNGQASEHDGEPELQAMSAVVKQASHKVDVMEQMLSALKERLREEEINTRKHQEDAQRLQDALSIQKQENSTVTAQKLSLESELSRIKQELDRKGTDLNSTALEISALKEEREELLVEQRSMMEGRLDNEASQEESAVQQTEMKLIGKERLLKQSQEELTALQENVNSLQQQLSSMKQEKDIIDKKAQRMKEVKKDMQASLQEVTKQLESARSSSIELQAKLDAAEIRNEALSQQVDRLGSESAAAKESNRSKDEAVSKLQSQMSEANQELLATQATLQELQDQKSSSSVQLQLLQDTVTQLQGDLVQANEQEALARKHLEQVQQEVSDTVDEIVHSAQDFPVTREKLHAALQAVGSQEKLGADVAFWGLPDVELQCRIDAMKQRRPDLQSQLSNIEMGLPESVRHELAQIRKRIDELQPRSNDSHNGSTTPVQSSYDAQQDSQRALLEASMKELLQRMLSTSQFRKHEAIQNELGQIALDLTCMTNTLDKPLKDRLLHLLAFRASRLQSIADEEASSPTLGLASAVEGSEASQSQDAHIAELQRQLRNRSSKAQQAEEHAKSQLDQAAANTARLERELEEARDASAHNELKDQRIAALEAALNTRDEELAATRQELEQLAAATSASEKQDAADGVSSSAEADPENDPAAPPQPAPDAASAASAQTIANLQQELSTLKERYSRQFITSKQQLDASEAKVRQLRKQLDARDKEQSKEDAAGGPEASSAPPMEHSPAEDISSWVSRLLEENSEKSNGSNLRAGGTVQLSSAPQRAPSSNGSTPSSAAVATAEPEVAQATIVTDPGTHEAEVDKIEEEEANTAAQDLRLLASGYCIPHPNKVEKGGEDAHFILGSYAIGVADGVGGWSKNGVDAGEYSRQLMRRTAQALLRDSSHETSCLDALRQAHSVVDVPGSATAIVARMADESHLEVLTVGDSGLRVIRDGSIVFATEALQHGFNMPYQLACAKYVSHTDLPQNGLRSLVSVEPGDIIVMASDGFFDNVWDYELTRLVKKSCLVEGEKVENCVEKVAESLASAAHDNSKDPNVRTPWSVASAEHRNVGFFRKLFPQGGKLDDISVVVAQVE